MESVIDQLGRQRFLSFDRDHATGAPTVEVAHEALLTGWDRLCDWIEDGRVDIVRRAALSTALNEWSQSGQDSDYLLTGKRLTDFERWRDSTALRLTTAESDYLAASLEHRDAAVKAETARAAREIGLKRLARRGWGALVAVLLVVGIVGIAVIVFGRGGERPTVAVLVQDEEGIHALLIVGLERAARDFHFDPVVVSRPFTDMDDAVARLGKSGTDLVLFSDDSVKNSVVKAASAFPDTTWAYVDSPDPSAFNGPSVGFAANEGAYLTGAAAALTSKTGIVGYVGGWQIENTERFRAGYEAGAPAMNPSIEVLAEYTSFDGSGFELEAADLAHDAAKSMYERGADVVIQGAGKAGAGVFAAAREQSEALHREVWAIGADSDQYYDVSEEERGHVLTSTIKALDVGVTSDQRFPRRRARAG